MLEVVAIIGGFIVYVGIYAGIILALVYGVKAYTEYNKRTQEQAAKVAEEQQRKEEEQIHERATRTIKVEAIEKYDRETTYLIKEYIATSQKYIREAKIHKRNGEVEKAKQCAQRASYYSDKVKEIIDIAYNKINERV